MLVSLVKFLTNSEISQHLMLITAVLLISQKFITKKPQFLMAINNPLLKTCCS
jgi:hypothetical protein